MKNKIAIILPYFGAFPKWMSLFVEGCRNNEFIDFIIYSDCKYEYNCPNIIFHEISFSAFCQQISEALSINFKPASAYKLCGLRPFLGYIFQEELKDYDFWGFCDLDLVFGNLRLLFNANNLLKYDVISTQGDRISGPLCIIRNSKEYREAAFRINGWQDLVLSPKMIPIDEKYFSDLLAPVLKPLRGLNRLILRNIFPLKIAKKVNDFISRPIIKYLATKKKQLYKETNSSPEAGVSSMSYIFKDGHIYDTINKEETPYLHFLFFKKNMYRKTFLWDDTANIDTSGLNLKEPVLIDKRGINNLECQKLR